MTPGEHARAAAFAARVISAGTKPKAVLLAKAYLDIGATITQERVKTGGRLRGLLFQVDTLLAAVAPSLPLTGAGR